MNRYLKQSCFVILLLLITLFPCMAHGAESLPRFEPGACPIEVPEDPPVECGYLVVPENHEKPDGAVVRLPVIIIPTQSAFSQPDPIIFTVGGPGYSSLPSVWGFISSIHAEDRDIIIFEQRGNRYAEPALVCDISTLWEEAPENTSCLDELQAKGIDLSQYNTQNIVRDMIALRQALGIEQWNLYGTSFSTTLMLSLMKADPDGTRSAILQSVLPPSETTFVQGTELALRAVQQMLDDCAADPACAAAYPDLEAQFYALIHSLNDSPVEVEVFSSNYDQKISLTISGEEFLDWVIINSYYHPSYPPFSTAYHPLLIAEMSDGNLSPLNGFVQNYWSGWIENSQWAWGLLFAINCQQALPAADGSRTAGDIAASERLDGFDKSSGQREICEAWNLPSLPPAGSEYIVSDIPALVLAGSYDPVTPPAWSRETADHLPNSTYVEFPGSGHNVTQDNPCAAALEAAFLTNPQSPLDLGCVAEAPGPSFYLPDDFYIAPGIANGGYDISLGGPKGVPWLEGLALISLLAVFVLLVVFIVIGLLWLLRWRKKGGELDKTAVIAYFLSLLIIVSVLAVPTLTTMINREYFEIDMILYGFGPERDFLPATLLAWLAPLAGLSVLTLAAITLWAWISRRWTISFRILNTLVVLASLFIFVIGIRWGLFTMLV